MVAETPEAKRERLVVYLAKSKTLHSRLRKATPIAFVLGVAMAIAGLPGIVWGLWLVLDLSVGGIGLWITFGHILDFEHQLKQLAGGDAGPRRPGL